MGRLPAEIRALTPWETAELIEAWNEAQGGDEPAAPTLEDYDALVARYGAGGRA